MNQYKCEWNFSIKKFLFIFSVLFLVGYGLFNARSLIMGPSVEIFSPTNNSETSENILVIKGRAKNVAFISLNQKSIFVNSEGFFEEKLLLSPGSNIIEIKVRDRFKKEILETLNIYYKQGATTLELIN